MSRKETFLRTGIIGLVVVIAVVAIVYGAYRGRNQDQSPESLTASISSSSDSDSESKDKDLRVIRTWTRKDCGLAPWLVTDKLGYFKEEGIKLVFTGEIQANQQIPSIINGTNDVSSAHPNTLAVAVKGGAKLKGVSVGGIEPDSKVNPKFRHMWWFINPKKYPSVKSLSDLKDIPGKLKFSTITTNICTDFLTNTLFEKYGIPIDKIEWVNMPDVQAIQSLKQELVDVSSVHPPFYKGMEDAGARKVADSSDTGLGATAGFTTYYFTEDFINKNPDTVRRFVKAISKGQKWANEHPDETAKWTENAIGIPVTGNHYYATNITIDEKLFKPWIKQLEKNKVLKTDQIKPSDLVIHVFDKE